MGDLGKLFKKSQVLNIGNPQAMHWGLGHYDRKDTTPFDALSKASRQNMTAKLVEDLMGKKPEKRFRFIQANAGKVDDLDI